MNRSKNVHRWILAGLLGTVAAFAVGQPGPVHATSLESTVLGSDALALGTLVSYRLAPDTRTIEDATIRVDEAIKGNLTGSIVVPVRRSFSTFLGWDEGRSRMLVVRKSGRLDLILLSDPRLAIMRTDFSVLRDAQGVVNAAKQIVLATPQGAGAHSMAIRVPHDRTKGFPQTGMGMYLEVPIDAALERRAQAAVRAKKGMGLDEAANVLGHFKSAENVALLKSLLSDPTSGDYAMPNGNLGKGRRFYFVRKAAFEALQALGVKVPRPVIEEEYYDPGAVTYVYLERERNVSAAVKGLSKFKNLTDLYLSQSSLTDADVRAIASLQHVKNLEIADTRISDAALAAIGRIRSLEMLNLDGTKISNSSLRSLASLPSLKFLALNRTPIDDRALTEIAKIRSLQWLGLSDTAVTAKGLAALRPLKNLREIELPKPEWQVTDEFLFALRDAGLMRAYPNAHAKGDKPAKSDADVVRVMIGEPLTDAGLAAFTTFKNLEEIYLSSAKIGDEGAKVLAGFPKLKGLVLNGTSISDAGLRTLSRLRSLESLALAETKITDAGLDAIGNLSNLDWLVLSGTRITDGGLAKLKPLTRLRTLIITDVDVTDAGLAHLHALPMLGTISLSGTKITDEGFLALANIPTLRSVTVWRVPGVTIEAIAKFHRLRPDVEVSR